MIPDHKRLTATFFRSVNSHELFKRFFEKYKTWDLLKLKDDPKNEAIYSAWEKLIHPTKEDMEENLMCMNDISNDDGRDYLTTVAEEVKLDYGQLTTHKLAMTMFLEHSARFRIAYDRFLVEKIENLKIFIGREIASCDPTESKLLNFKEKLKSSFQHLDQGPKLKVESVSNKDNRWVFVVAYENFLKPDHVFQPGDTIGTQERRPVYEMVIIYYAEKAILKLKVGKGKKKAETVASVFATEILGKRPDHFQIANIVNLDPLFVPGFDFSKRNDDHFEYAKLVEIKFTAKDDRSFRQMMHCTDTNDGRQSVIEKLNEQGLSLQNIDVQEIAILFQYPGGMKKRRTVYLRPPNKCTLDETPRDRYLETVLTRWGLYDVEARRGNKSVKPVEQTV